MSKLKTIKESDIDKLIRQTQIRIDYLKKETDVEDVYNRMAWVKVGYAQGYLETLIKQLKGEYPIL